MDEMDERILNELTKSNNKTEIARKLKLSRLTIYRRIKIMQEKGIEIPEEPLDEINKLILQELAGGNNISYIAKITGLYPSTIYDRINKMRKRGIKIPGKPLNEINKLILQELAGGNNISYIAKMTGLSKSTIYDRINKMRKRGIVIPQISETENNELDNKIKKGLDEQKTPTEIAKEIGVSRSIISLRISQMRERGVNIPNTIDKKRNQFIKTIEFEDRNKEIIEGLENRLTQAEIASNIGISRQAVNQRIKKLDKAIKKRLAIMIVNFLTTKNATIEQIKAIGECYGVDVEEVLNSLDEQER